MSFASFGDDMDDAAVRWQLKRMRAAMGVLATQLTMEHLTMDLTQRPDAIPDAPCEGCGATREELVEAVTLDALEKADALIAQELTREPDMRTR